MAIFPSNMFYKRRHPIDTLGIAANSPLSLARNGRAEGALPAPTIAKGVAAGAWLPSTDRPNTQFPRQLNGGSTGAYHFLDRSAIVYSGRCKFLYISAMAIGVRDGPRFYLRGFRRVTYARMALRNHRYRVISET